MSTRDTLICSPGVSRSRSLSREMRPSPKLHSELFGEQVTFNHKHAD